ncbi:MAG TPA: DNA repair protein RecO [Elusimicrobiales bacterium]|nr:DNA repair protein RecO [Elusimicrobiales bacterium]
MTFNDFTITLIRKPIRESDIIASVYTKTRGRFNIRFPGVKKHKGKLKIFAEPFVWAELRVYLRTGASVGCITGGKVCSVFKNIRKDLTKTQLALHFCELMFKLTPIHQPNEDKYFLLLSALKSLNDYAPSDAIRESFTLRLMQTAGFGVKNPPLGIDLQFWNKLHEGDFHNLNITGEKEAEYLSKTKYIITRFLNQHFDIPLKTLSFIGKLNSAKEQVLVNK